MKAKFIMEIEIPGEVDQVFLTEGKYALLHRTIYSIADAAAAVGKVAPCKWEQTIEITR